MQGWSQPFEAEASPAHGSQGSWLQATLTIHKICLFLTRELISVGQLGYVNHTPCLGKGPVEILESIHWHLCTWSAPTTWILHCQLSSCRNDWTNEHWHLDHVFILFCCFTRQKVQIVTYAQTIGSFEGGEINIHALLLFQKEALTEKLCFQLIFLNNLKRVSQRLLLPFLTLQPKPHERLTDSHEYSYSSYNCLCYMAHCVLSQWDHSRKENVNITFIFYWIHIWFVCRIRPLGGFPKQKSKHQSQDLCMRLEEDNYNCAGWLLYMLLINTSLSSTWQYLTKLMQKSFTRGNILKWEIKWRTCGLEN